MHLALSFNSNHFEPLPSTLIQFHPTSSTFIHFIHFHPFYPFSSTFIYNIHLNQFSSIVILLSTLIHFHPLFSTFIHFNQFLCILIFVIHFHLFLLFLIHVIHFHPRSVSWSVLDDIERLQMFLKKSTVFKKWLP